MNKWLTEHRGPLHEKYLAMLNSVQAKFIDLSYFAWPLHGNSTLLRWGED